MKRTCPYDSSLSRMSKVHLMNHDVDKSALEKIHADTLQRLMCRTRKNDLLNKPESADQVLTSAKPLKQMEVTKFFVCLNKGNLQTQIQRERPIEIQLTEQCFYCDNKALMTPCSSCQTYYCEACTFVRYDRTGEYYVCLSCS